MERVRLYKGNESLAVMKDINNKTAGVDISEYATDVINTEELYTSLNQVTFKYEPGLPYAADLQQNNFIRVLTNGNYNLFIIQYVEYDTDDEILRVECDHYTTIYAGEMVPNFTLYNNKLKISQVISLLNSSKYKSTDYNIRFDSASNDTDAVDLADYTPGNQTMGQLWTGSSAFLRIRYGVLIIRDLQGITIINPENQKTQQMPLTLGVNIKGLSYKLEEPERYTSAMVNLSTIPTFEVQGTGLEDTKKIHNGIAGTNLSNFSDMDEGDEIQVFYKGLLVCIRKSGGQLKLQPYSKPRLLHTVESLNIDELFHQNVETPFNGTHIKIVQGDAGNEVTLLDEPLDVDYLQGYRAYVNYKTINADPHGKLGTQKYFGFTPKDSNGVGDDGLEVIFSQISKELYKVPVANHNYTGRGNNMYLVDYPEPESDSVRSGDKTWGFTEAYHFYRWFFNDYKGFWYSDEAKKLNQPRFNATVEIDAMTSIFGTEYLNIIQFRLGDKYNVRAIKQGLDFESEITKITYSVSEIELISVEFGSEQDFEVEEVRKSSRTEEQSRRIYNKEKTGNSSGNETSAKRRSNTKPVITLAETTLDPTGNNRQSFIDNLISATDKEDGNITHNVTILYSDDESQATYTVTDSDGNTTTKTARMAASGGDVDEEWLGHWLDDILNGEGIRLEEDLFNGDLPYITRTDDTGIPRMEWEPPYVTISTDGEETTPTKLVCYNGAEAVISEVKFKGGYDTVRLYSDGRFYSDRTSLPDNVGFPIVPFPPGTNTSNRTWTPVFNVVAGEIFTKDTEHGDYQFTEGNGSTPEDIALVKEELGYRYHHSINATTKGTIKFETERVMFQRNLNEFGKKIGVGNTTNGTPSMYQVKDKEEFRREVLDRIQGKTVIRNGYSADLPNESQSLAYYIKQLEDGDQPYLKSVYRSILGRILYHLADRTAYAPGEVITIGDILKVTVEFTGESWGAVRYKRIIGVDFDEKALEQLAPREGPFLKEEQGWQRLMFTQPTTKVSDQTVKVNQLLITNDGVSVVDAAISKSEIDKLWDKLSKEERKEFESTYGQEWLFNLKNRPEQYDSDDVLLGEIYRSKNNVETGEVFDPFGVYAARDKRDKERIKRIAERYQQKYNFLVSKGYVVPKSVQGQVTYDKIDKYYKSQL